MPPLSPDLVKIFTKVEEQPDVTYPARVDEYNAWLEFKNQTRPISLELHNNGDATAHNIDLFLYCSIDRGIILLDKEEMKNREKFKPPKQSRLSASDIFSSISGLRLLPSPQVGRAHKWVINKLDERAIFQARFSIEQLKHGWFYKCPILFLHIPQDYPENVILLGYEISIEESIKIPLNTLTIKLSQDSQEYPLVLD